MNHGDYVNFPTLKIEDRELPVMLCGSSSFIGEGHFGFRAFDHRIRFYNHPDSMADIFIHFVRQGCKGAHVICYDNIMKAVRIAYEVETFPIAASLITTTKMATQLKTLARLETVLVFVHPSQTDSLEEKTLKAVTREIRDAGMIPGLATHLPGASIPALDQMNIDFSAYMTPVNKEGKYMIPSKEKALEAIRSTKKKIVAARPLFTEKISLEEGFRFAIEHSDAFCPAFTSKDQIDDAYTILDRVLKTKT